MRSQACDSCSTIVRRHGNLWILSLIRWLNLKRFSSLNHATFREHESYIKRPLKVQQHMPVTSVDLNITQFCLSFNSTSQTPCSKRLGELFSATNRALNWNSKLCKCAELKGSSARRKSTARTVNRRSLLCLDRRNVEVDSFCDFRQFGGWKKVQPDFVLRLEVEGNFEATDHHIPGRLWEWLVQHVQRHQRPIAFHRTAM